MIVNEKGELREQTERIQGKAGIEATQAVPGKHPEWQQSYNELGRTGLTVSAAGFGTYRVDYRVQMHRAAFAKAVRMGINLVDTSSNYAGGNSERLVGEVMKGLISHDVAKREEVVVVSKGGYIQGELFAETQRRANTPHADYSAGSELSELVRHSEGLWHSIHPDFLRDQITDSLDRLQMATIDIYLLHNPEYFVQWAIADERPEEEVREEYLRRIKRAFAYLEDEVKQGRIQWYGISSNTFPKSEEAIDRTSLERCWQAAEELKAELGLDDHHFGVVQFPFNIFETGAFTEENQKRSTHSVLAYAQEVNLGVLINRPLNAIVGRQLLRLVDYPERDTPPEDDVEGMVHDLKLQEEEFLKTLLPTLELNPQQRESIMQLLAIGRQLDGGNWKLFSNVEEWQDVSTTVLAPRVQYVFDVLRAPSHQNEPLFKFLTEYAETADETFEHISNYYTTQAFQRSQKIHDALNGLLPDATFALSLSQKAVLLVRSTPGVSSVLVGMRSEEYVDDVVYGLQAEKLRDVEDVWERLASVKAQ